MQRSWSDGGTFAQDQVSSEGWDAFQAYLDRDVPPPLTDADTRVREDEAWSNAAAAFLQAKRDAEAAENRLNTVRGRLTALIEHPREKGAGVVVTRFWKIGNVDYKSVPALRGVNLDDYRAKPREEVRVAAV